MIGKGLIASMALLLSSHLLAEISVPHEFEAGNTALAAEVNANFAALVQHIQSLQERIDELEDELADVQASDAMALNEVMELVPDPHAGQGQTVRFTNINLQLVNGLGSSDSHNGLGNLILGYNEDRQGDEICSRGSRYNSSATNAEQRCLGGNGTWATSFKTGSHNLVAGKGNAYSGYGGVVLGKNNAATGAFASVIGGQDNVVAGEGSVIVSGFDNEISGMKAVVLSRTGGDSAIISGNGNQIEQAYQAAIVAGSGNKATDADTTSNSNGAIYASILGGQSNSVVESRSAIVGGWNNTASGQYSVVVGGGQQNEAAGARSVVLGGSSTTANSTEEIAP